MNSHPCSAPWPRVLHVCASRRPHACEHQPPVDHWHETSLTAEQLLTASIQKKFETSQNWCELSLNQAVEMMQSWIVHSTVKNKTVPWHIYSNMRGKHIEYRRVLWTTLPPHSTAYCSILYRTVIYGAIQYNAVQYSDGSTQYCKNQHSKYGYMRGTNRVSTSIQNCRRILQHTLPRSEIRCNTVQCSAV